MKTQRLKAKTCLILSTVTLLLSSCSTPSPDQARTQTTPENPDTIISIGGSSETYPALELLSDAYKAENKNIKFKFYPPSQSRGGIESVKQNLIDVGGVSRVIAADEAGTQLNYLPIVETPLVAVVHNSVTNVTNLSADQLKAIYKGDLNNWQQLGGPDAEIILLDFTEEENEKQVLRQVYLGKDLKITPQAVVFSEDDELMDTLGNTPFSVAVLPDEDEMEELPVKALSIDGVAPSSNTLQAGTYKLKMLMGVVSSKKNKPEVQSFLEFATGPKGHQVLAAAGLVAVQPAQK
jgi:phosphate transport system substrate-binding protein